MFTINILLDYPYMYETHLHTSESSACARSTAVDMCKAHKEAGYTGIIITNHNWGGNTCVDRSLPWNEWVDRFFAPCFEAMEWGRANDFDVFYGYEAGFDATEFLIYGLTTDFLKAHPEIRDASLEEHILMAQKAGALTVHAHPFREELYIKEVRLKPEITEAVEAINACHTSSRSQSHMGEHFDTQAIAYAREHNFPMTAGSDVHTTRVIGGGVGFPERLSSLEDYIRIIRSGTGYVLSNYDHFFDSKGYMIATP